jgi:hypothetical protein
MGEALEQARARPFQQNLEEEALANIGRRCSLLQCWTGALALLACRSCMRQPARVLPHYAHGMGRVEYILKARNEAITTVLEAMHIGGGEKYKSLTCKSSSQHVWWCMHSKYKQKVLRFPKHKHHNR